MSSSQKKPTCRQCDSEDVTDYAPKFDLDGLDIGPYDFDTYYRCNR